MYTILKQPYRHVLESVFIMKENKSTVIIINAKRNPN